MSCFKWCNVFALCIISATIFGVGIGTAAEKADIIVARDGSGNFTTIQAAINSVSSSNSKNVTILVKNGTYNEHIVIDKSYISLIGESREKTIIQFSIERTQWNSTNGSNVGCAVINIGCGTDYKKVSSTVTDITIGNLTVENTYNSTGLKTMAIKDEGNSNRVIVVHCNVWCKGHDTISLWTKATGMYYHSDCSFKGSIDAVCPRGWCYAVACDFYQTTSSAPLWHEGATGTTQKFVVRTGNFKPAEGNSSSFKLLNGQLENKFYILDGTMSSKVTTMGTVHKAYFFNCHGESNDLSWYADNLSSAPGSPKNSDITAKWTFENKWDPENEMPAVLTYASIPQPWNKAYDVPGNVQLKWIKARNAEKYEVYFGTSSNPPLVATQTENSYTPGNLSKGTYFWRVDAIEGSNTTKGNQWVFAVGGSVAVSDDLDKSTISAPFLNTVIESENILRVTFNSDDQAPVSLKLFDIQGKEVAVLPVHVKNAGTQTESFNLKNFDIAKGNYVVRMNTGNSTITSPIVLK